MEDWQGVFTPTSILGLAAGRNYQTLWRLSNQEELSEEDRRAAQTMINLLEGAKSQVQVLRSGNMKRYDQKGMEYYQRFALALGYSTPQQAQESLQRTIGEINRTLEGRTEYLEKLKKLFETIEKQAIRDSSSTGKSLELRAA